MTPGITFTILVSIFNVEKRLTGQLSTQVNISRYTGVNLCSRIMTPHLQYNLMILKEKDPGVIFRHVKHEERYPPPPSLSR